MCKFSKLKCPGLYNCSFVTFLAHENGENHQFKIILEELNKIKKREAKNSQNIKFLVRKVTEEDSEALSFVYPLKYEPVYKKFDESLSKPRFVKKLVMFYIHICNFCIVCIEFEVMWTSE